jgi:molybdopterin molybdotransferase
MSPAEDVRMRGFRTRKSVDEVLAWIEDNVTGLNKTESVPLEQAAGRIVATEAISPIAVPRFDRAAMDGYAVIAEDTIGASSSNPVFLRVLKESLPGQAAGVAVQSGTAIRIMTGGPVPVGSTAVVPVEMTRPSTSHEDGIEVTEAIADSNHIGRVGEDITAGAVVCRAGTCLLPQHIGVLASVGMETVDVVVRPRIRIVATGREIVPAGSTLGDHQIHDANSPMLAALIERDAGTVESAIRIADDPSQITAALLEPGADVILVSGGSSVGAEDFAPMIVAKHGELPVHGIAMRPSSPAGMGRIGTSLLFLLPGNPVSCLCAYDFFAGRAIRMLGKRNPEWPYHQVRRPLTRRIVSAIGRTDYCRVRVTETGIEPVAISGASILSSITRADGFVVVPPPLEGHPAGQNVDVWLYAQTKGTQLIVR